MSTMRKIATGMTNFAKGIYKEMDGQAINKMNKLHIEKNITNGMTKEVAKTSADASIKAMQNSNAFKMGANVSKAAPFKGIMDSAREYYGHANSGSKIGIKQAIKTGHMTNNQLDYKKVAGTAATIGVAGRVASGGGLYRDRYGNVNVPGLPFI